VNQLTDQQLLDAYGLRRCEQAFAELVRRHIDFVYSAALRMVRDRHLAEDVTQGVFVALARNAAALRSRAVLSGWLHRTAHNIAAQTVRSAVRRRAREEEAARMNESLPPQPDADWQDLAPHLDAALEELGEADRHALLLRYFERKSARDMADLLGISDEAAQKRVNRAVERVRQCLARRGLTIAATGLAGALSANAVHAAPAGLAIAITGTALAGAVLPMAAVATAGQAVALTGLHKLVFTTAVMFSALTPLWVRQRAQSKLAGQEFALRQQANRLARLQEENQRLARMIAEASVAPSVPQSELSELLRLRGEVGRLSREVQELLALQKESPAAPTNSVAAHVKRRLPG
jgi:RNA polymerase sigma factor (sigma-70 family)